MALRRELPVHSPIVGTAILRAARAAAGRSNPSAGVRSRIGDCFGTEESRLYDSGTSALRVAVRAALDHTGGRVVALPGYVCYDVATAAVGAGARIRLYDLSPDTLGPDWGSLRECLAAGASVVVAAHLYGIPVDMDRLGGLAGEFDAVVIDDAAQGIGGSFGGRPLGSSGSLGVLSFGRGKGLTGGSGGALLANDATGRGMMDRLDRVGPGPAGWGSLARLLGQWLLARPRVYGIPARLPWLGLGETVYGEPWTPGPIDRSAATGLLANWEASMAEAATRQRKAADLAARLRAVGFRVPAPSGGEAGWLRLPVLAPDARTADRLESEGVRWGVVRGYPGTLAGLPPVRGRLEGARDLPGAELLARMLFTMPVHSRAPEPRELVSGLRLEVCP